jgi:type I restriction enzyme, S subunit
MKNKFQPLDAMCNVEYGTRVVQKRDGSKGYPVYGGGGATFEMDHYNREDRLVIARFGMSEECTRFVAGKFFLNDSGLTVSPKNGELVQGFLDYQMLSLNDDIYALGKGTAQKNLDVPLFRTMSLYIPESIEEQRRIVGILDEAFEGIATAKANAEQNLRNVRALFDSYLQSVFTRCRRECEVTRLAAICERVSVGHVGPTSKFYCDASDGVPFLRSQNVRRGKLDWDGVQYITKVFHAKLRNSQIRYGDLLFVRVGANRGDCCAVLEDVAELNCANIVFARPNDDTAAYLERYCQSPQGRAQLLGMTTGSAQGVINTRSVANLMIPLPEKSDRDKIVAEVDEIDETTQHLSRLNEEKLVALEALKKSLLHQAFSNQL